MKPLLLILLLIMVGCQNNADKIELSRANGAMRYKIAVMKYMVIRTNKKLNWDRIDSIYNSDLKNNLYEK
jgi:hypothetical protein